MPRATPSAGYAVVRPVFVAERAVLATSGRVALEVVRGPEVVRVTLEVVRLAAEDVIDSFGKVRAVEDDARTPPNKDTFGCDLASDLEPLQADDVSLWTLEAAALAVVVDAAVKWLLTLDKP